MLLSVSIGANSNRTRLFWIGLSWHHWLLVCFMSLSNIITFENSTITMCNETVMPCKGTTLHLVIHISDLSVKYDVIETGSFVSSGVSEKQINTTLVWGLRLDLSLQVECMFYHIITVTSIHHLSNFYVTFALLDFLFHICLLRYFILFEALCLQTPRLFSLDTHLDEQICEVGGMKF